MPRASVSATTAVKPGFFRSWRKANSKSFMTQKPSIGSRKVAPKVGLLAQPDFRRTTHRNPQDFQMESLPHRPGDSVLAGSILSNAREIRILLLQQNSQRP